MASVRKLLREFAEVDMTIRMIDEGKMDYVFRDDAAKREMRAYLYQRLLQLLTAACEKQVADGELVRVIDPVTGETKYGLHS